MGIPIAHRRPHVTGQRAAHAPKSPKASGSTEDTLSRPPPHLRDHGPAKRRGRQDRQQYAGPLLRGLHAGHLRPRHHRRPTQSGANNGQYPIPCGIDLSATRSRWGHRLGQKKSGTLKTELMKSKSPRNQMISRTFGTLRLPKIEPCLFFGGGVLFYPESLGFARG